jgi:predicted unusual protein kinase regulating ubiquinone biosynthesis (AarF/ABC1/UbiB family)
MLYNIKSYYILLNQLLNNIWFVITICWIFFDELSLYFIFRNYDNLLNNLTRRLADKNILYVKIFQALALNNNLISNQNQNILLKYTDNAPWTKKDIDMDALFRLEREYDVMILNSYTPIKAGMISLVFKCTRYYKTTNKIETFIVKMKRKNIEVILNDGIQKLLFCVKLLSYIPIVDNYQISNIIHDNINLIERQTNFKKEVENINTMKNNCKNLKYIKIPVVYEEVTHKLSNIIMMEYIKGDTLQEVDIEDYDEYSKPIIKFVLVTVIMNGICHGDLHTGNILFIKDENDPKYKYKIGILDFGIVYEIGKMKNTIYYIFANMYTDSPEIMAENLLSSGIIEPIECITNLPKIHYKNILDILTTFINDTVHISKHFNQINVFKSLYELNDYFVKHNLIINGVNIRPCDDLVKIQVIFTMLYGVILKLCGPNYIEITNKIMIDLFHIDVSES